MRGDIQGKRDHGNHNRRKACTCQYSVIEQQQKHQYRCAAKHCNIYTGKCSYHPIFPHPKITDHCSERRAKQQRKGGDLHRNEESLQNREIRSSLYKNRVQLLT